MIATSTNQGGAGTAGGVERTDGGGKIQAITAERSDPKAHT
jgi:hypothetical protein